MRTEFRTKKEYADRLLQIAETTDTCGKCRPERFKRTMRENRGSVNLLSPYGPAADGLERKNPVIVALGDSVTAGHFEYAGNPAEIFAKVDAGTIGEEDAVEITDARECYLERFRAQLIDWYEQTSVSTINAGIAGDTMYGMERRLYRDVIRYQSDLVIINGALNWPKECGSTEDYRAALARVLASVAGETKADIVLLTPNMECAPEEFRVFVPEQCRIYHYPQYGALQRGFYHSGNGRSGRGGYFAERDQE